MTNWTCSSSYSSSSYSNYLCPFIKGNCGENNTIILNNTGDQESINVTLTSGQTCFYKVQSECGVPAFEPNTTEGFDIVTIDYTESDLSSNQSSNSDNGGKSQNSKNDDNVPAKTQNFNQKNNNQGGMNGQGGNNQGGNGQNGNGQGGNGQGGNGQNGNGQGGNG